MKISFKYLSYAIVILIGFLYSCKNEPINSFESIDQQSHVQYINYKGQKAVIPHGYPKELFNQSPEDFAKYFKILLESNRSRSTGDEFTIPYEDLQSILQNRVDEYPKITLDNIISEDDILKIYSDFPDIHSSAEIDSNRSVIFDYYQDLCKRDVALDVINYQSSGQNSKILSPGTPSGPETTHLLSNPSYALAYVNSAQDANFYTQALYGNLADNNMGNAFRHAVWNAFSI